MSDIQTSLAAILAAHNVIQTQTQTLMASLTDASIPLDDRWDAYTKLVTNNVLVAEPSMSDGYLGEIFGHNNISIYDDFNTDRYASISFPDMWDKMTDESAWSDIPDVYASRTLRDRWRERVLASGFSGFTYDW